MSNIFKLLKSMFKKQLKYPLSNDILYDILHTNLCPDCQTTAYDCLVIGPSAGGSQNIKCFYCGSFFNDMTPIGIERIFWHDHHARIIQMECNNYTPFTSFIIKNWAHVEINTDTLWKHHTGDAIYTWCINNCSNKWSVKVGQLNNGNSYYYYNDYQTHTFFFKEQNDAVLFKLSLN